MQRSAGCAADMQRDEAIYSQKSAISEVTNKMKGQVMLKQNLMYFNYSANDYSACVNIQVYVC